MGRLYLKEPTAKFHVLTEEFKKCLIRNMLVACDGNRTRTAKELGLQRTYLLKLMREYNIEAAPWRRPQHTGSK